MTVSTTTAKVGYLGDGTTTAFAVPFVFFGQAELEVVERVVSTGTETVKTLTTHYTVSGGNGGTGTVTAVSPPPSSVTWTISRKTARTQLTDYQTGDAFPADTHERALDRLTALVQEIEEILGRSLRGPVSDTAALGQLVPAAQRASKVLVFDAAGQPAVADVAGLASITAAAYVVAEVITATGATAYTLAVAPGSAAAAMVSVNGVMQAPGANYTVAGQILTFAVAPSAGATILVRSIVAAGSFDMAPLYWASGAVGVGNSPAAAGYPSGANWAHYVAATGVWGWHARTTSGLLSSNGNAALARTSQRITTSSYTVTDADCWLLNQAGGTLTLTLPTLDRGREIMVTNQAAQAVVSAASDVVPIDGSTAGTAILPATAGAWCTLVGQRTGTFSTQWRVMQRGT